MMVITVTSASSSRRTYVWHMHVGPDCQVLALAGTVLQRCNDALAQAGLCGQEGEGGGRLEFGRLSWAPAVASVVGGGAYSYNSSEVYVCG
jgi:hypothetical protein